MKLFRAFRIFRLFVVGGCLLLIGLGGCKNGKIACPKIGGKHKFALFKKKADPTKPNEAGFGQDQRMSYGKDGLMKKKAYKIPRPKPRRLKSV